MTLKKVKQLIDERKISELMKYFYVVTFRKYGDVDVQGFVQHAKLKNWKEWKKDGVHYLITYKNINITLHK